MDWISDQIRRAAGEVERAGGTIRAFQRVVEERLAETPLTGWETLFWTRGLRRGLIQLNSHWFRLGSGRQSSFSFFVRNEAGLLVGLRRESLTQAAVYAALITHYGHPRARVRFEMDFLDVALQDAAGGVSLYAETKASDRVLERLVEELATGFADGLPFLDLPEGKKPPDPFQKAAHILRTRPAHFWAVSPGRRLAFAVEYAGPGFRLTPAPEIPFHQEADLFSAIAGAA
jgi:hypothetical protein